MIYFKHFKIGLIPIKFKYDFLHLQFYETLDPRLRAMLLEFAYLSRKEFRVTPVITQIYRTQSQQNYYYRDKIEAGYYVVKNGQTYYSKNKKTPTMSVHQMVPCRGVDIRDRTYTDDQVKFIDRHIEKYFPYGRGKQSLVRHNILGSHIHLQCPAAVGPG